MTVICFKCGKSFAVDTTKDPVSYVVQYAAELITGPVYEATCPHCGEHLKAYGTRTFK
jgi:hypothetical protein